MTRSPVKVALAVVVGIFLGLASPALARTVADFARFARDAHRVDGIHAVRSDASRAERARRLVATDAEGYLPHDIIQLPSKAADADTLDGMDSSAFKTRCQGVKASIFVPADAPMDRGYVDDRTLNVPSYSCIGAEISVRHMSTGVYRVLFRSLVVSAQGGPVPRAAVLITPAGATALTSYNVVADQSVNFCPSEGMDAPMCPMTFAVEITLRDLSGAPIDTSFTAALV